MLPAKSRESAEIGVGRHHRAAMLHGDRRVLSIGDQLSRGARRTAQSFKYLHVIEAGSHDARRRALYQRGHEGERLIECGCWVEDSGIGHYADEAG